MPRDNESIRERINRTTGVNRRINRRRRLDQAVTTFMTQRTPAQRRLERNIDRRKSNGGRGG